MKDVLVSFKYKSHYGSVDAIYIMNVVDYKKIKFLKDADAEIYLGDVFGKHSDVVCSVNNFTLISQKEDEVESFRKLFGNTFGSYTPFDSAMEIFEDYRREEEDELD